MENTSKGCKNCTSTGLFFEAITNAILPADYAMKGVTITISIFDDRIEFTNPGGLTFGLTMEHALEGASRLRNRVIGMVFKELRLIERWGLGLRNIISQCMQMGLPHPKFEELHNRFRVTLYGLRTAKMRLEPWQELLVRHLRKHDKVTPTEAAQIWNLTVRTSRIRLRELMNTGIIKRIASSQKDPTAFYVLSEGIEI
jgi:ATP-dependent DNA helicase RecG